MACQKDENKEPNSSLRSSQYCILPRALHLLLYGLIIRRYPDRRVDVGSSLLLLGVSSCVHMRERYRSVRQRHIMNSLKTKRIGDDCEVVVVQSQPDAGMRLDRYRPFLWYNIIVRKLTFQFQFGARDLLFKHFRTSFMCQTVIAKKIQRFSDQCS